MMRFALFLTVSLATFLAGLTSSWSVNYLWNALTGPEQFIAPLSDSSEDIDVVLIGIVELHGMRYADFIVANRGSETAYYTGYSRESHCSYVVKQRGHIWTGSVCSCGNGLSEQSLNAGDTVIFAIPIHNNSDPFEIGLDFKMGDARLKRTAWSRMIQTPSAGPVF
jgi:hypothetical protein